MQQTASKRTLPRLFVAADRKRSAATQLIRNVTFVNTPRAVGVQGMVCTVVAAAVTHLYLTQPILPGLAAEFGVHETTASLSLSMVILGITLSNLPFGTLGDRYPMCPLLLIAGAVVIVGALVCAITANLTILVATRFLQGLFLPALTTCDNHGVHTAQKRPIWEVIVEIGAQIPDEVWATVPDDASINYKHYLYGVPKKQA
jgi:hypothetical protein